MIISMQINAKEISGYYFITTYLNSISIGKTDKIPLIELLQIFVDLKATVIQFIYLKRQIQNIDEYFSYLRT